MSIALTHEIKYVCVYFAGVSYFVYFYWYSGLTQLIQVVAKVNAIATLNKYVLHIFISSCRKRLCPQLIIYWWHGWLAP